MDLALRTVARGNTMPIRSLSPATLPRHRGTVSLPSPQTGVPGAQFSPAVFDQGYTDWEKALVAANRVGAGTGAAVARDSFSSKKSRCSRYHPAVNSRPRLRS